MADSPYNEGCFLKLISNSLVSKVLSPMRRVVGGLRLTTSPMSESVLVNFNIKIIKSFAEFYLTKSTSPHITNQSFVPKYPKKVDRFHP